MSQPKQVVLLEHVEQWRQANENSFHPPVCNKLMYRNQLSIMFVGGPNTRTDFHIEEGSEFFFQIRGNMHLPTVQAKQRHVVNISEGKVFLLPPHIPHSPQRPEAGSFGLVVERIRNEKELDCLRWFVDFNKCDEILYEKYFHCYDLGRDLVPVVQEFRASTEFQTNQPGGHVVPDDERPFVQDTTTVVPEPFSFDEFLVQNKAQLAQGDVPLFGPDHPHSEFSVVVTGGPSQQSHFSPNEVFLWQYRGSASLTIEGVDMVLEDGFCCVLAAGTAFQVSRTSPDSIGLLVTIKSETN